LPVEVIRQTDWLFFKLTLSLRDVEEIFADYALVPVLSGISMKCSSAHTGAACSWGGLSIRKARGSHAAPETLQQTCGPETAAEIARQGYGPLKS